MLAMYRKCKQKVCAWETVRRNWKGNKEKIDKVAGVLAITKEPKPEDEPVFPTEVMTEVMAVMMEDASTPEPQLNNDECQSHGRLAVSASN